MGHRRNDLAWRAVLVGNALALGYLAWRAPHVDAAVVLAFAVLVDAAAVCWQVLAAVAAARRHRPSSPSPSHADRDARAVPTFGPVVEIRIER